MKEKDIPARMRLLLEDYLCMLARKNGAVKPVLEESSDGDMIIVDYQTNRVFAIKLDELV